MGRQLTWIPPSVPAGIVLNNQMAGYRVSKGASGLGAPAVQLLTTEVPGLDGDQVIDLYAPARTVQIPMVVWGPDRATYRARLRTLIQSLDPGVEGQLELAQEDGTRYRLRCRYAGGMEGSETRDEGWDGAWSRHVLTLHASDPWWYAAAPITAVFNYSTLTNFFPILPLRVNPSAVLGSVTVTNPGDVASPPTWTVTGPGSDLTLTNTATGEVLALSGALPSGRTLTIVTALGQQSVSLSDGTDWWPRLVGNPTFWQIPAGSTPISLVLTGASAGSSVTLQWTPRYRSPL